MTGRDRMARFARTALGLPPSAPVHIAALGGRGSDRRFFRLTWHGNGSAILIDYDDVRKENAYYANIAAFLDRIGVPAPRFMGHDSEARLMIMEDLGDEDLWSFRSSTRGERRRHYEATLAVARRLHSFPPEDFPRHSVRLMEAFDPGLYRWERDYFRDHFVKAVCGIELQVVGAEMLEVELARLAAALHAGPRSLVHRDFQSQNVMIRDGRPFLIDFQGMRFGNPFYDIASLLNDPYADLKADELEELLHFYCGISAGSLSRADFHRAFWEASAQRLMQALGAYGFLGLTKGLPKFLDHIPAALVRLARAATETQTLPRLQELLDRCRQALEQGHRISAPNS